jgi:hypothetical protein
MAAFAGEKRRSGVKKPTLACKRTTFGLARFAGFMDFRNLVGGAFIGLIWLL